jgi:hypothetical protein
VAAVLKALLPVQHPCINFGIERVEGFGHGVLDQLGVLLIVGGIYLLYQA